MAVRLAEWLDLMGSDYLERYIPDDGFTVKFAIVEAGEAPTLSRRLEYLAGAHGLLWAPIDAAVTRLHMMQDLFFAVARRVDWERISQTFVEALLAQNAHQWPRPGLPASFHAVAAHNQIAEPVFRRDVKQWLTRAIWDDSLLSQDFRAAMMRLCLDRFEPDPPLGQPVIQWLRGELSRISAVKGDDISGRIARDNARPMLASLCRWLAKTGAAGVMVFIDISQLARKGAQGGAGLRYSNAAVMDAYEVLRQIIDDAEHYPRFALVAAGPPDLIDGHPGRVISQYQALQMRIWDDVRPGERDNPLAPLVRLAP